MYLDESGRKIEEGKKNVKSGNCDIELSTSFFFFSFEGDRRRWQLLRNAIHAKRMLLRIAGRSLNGMAFSTETGSSR